MSKLPVVFATDGNYVPHLAVAMQSLLENNKDIEFEVYVISNGLHSSDENKLGLIASKYSVCINFFTLCDSEFDGLVLNDHFKKSNYYRLFIEDIVKGDKCLYLDSDIVVKGSLKEMVTIDISGVYLAAVEDPGFDRHQQLNMRQESKYFNSGVMLINVRKWREVSLKNSVVDYVRLNPDVIEYVEQCGLNSVVDGRWLEISAMYNFQKKVMENEVKVNKKIITDPVIVHYTGSEKPWHQASLHPFKKDYWAVRKRTPYRAFLSDDFKISRLLKKMIPKHILLILRRLKQYR